MPRPQASPEAAELMRRIGNLKRKARRQLQQVPPVIDLTLQDEIKELQEALSVVRENDIVYRSFGD